MLKPVVAAAIVLAVAGSSIVYAQQVFDRHGGYGDGGFRAEHRHRPSAADMAAFTDARIAALKAGLELTSDQAKSWPAFEQALRDLAQMRIQRMQAREAANQQTQPAPTTPFERLARRADRMSKASAALKQIADTGAPLYLSLDDAQKNRFTMLAHLLRPHHHHMHFGNRGDHGWREGQGYGRGDWRQGQGYGRDGGRDGHWFGHDGRGFGQDGRGPSGRIHDLMDNEDQGSEL
jgi:zinc resistance-associated protein